MNQLGFEPASSFPLKAVQKDMESFLPLTTNLTEADNWVNAKSKCFKLLGKYDQACCQSNKLIQVIR